MKRNNLKKVTALALVGLMFTTYAYAASIPTVNLGSASDFSILAGSAITNTGSSVIGGDLGLSPGTAVTGFPPAVLSGTSHISDAEAITAKNDLVTAYNDAVGRTPATSIGTELGGTILLPGVYTSGTLGITGTLTLDGAGDASSVFVLIAGSTLITAAGSNVVLTGGAQACNVFWVIGSSATLGANSSMKGSLLALTSITLNTGANVEGRLLARNGAVTLDSNNVSESNCSAAPAPTPTPVIVVTPAATTTPTEVVVATTTAVLTAPISFVGATSTVAYVPAMPNTGVEPLNRNISAMVAASLLLLASGFLLLNNKKVQMHS